MDAPKEGNIDAESCNEVDDEKSNSDCQSMPAYMNSVIRRQFLQERVKALPAPVQNCITALKNFQLEQLSIEAEFFEEVCKLEKKYQSKYQPMLDKRKEIVVGTVVGSDKNFETPARSSEMPQPLIDHHKKNDDDDILSPNVPEPRRSRMWFNPNK